MRQAVIQWGCARKLHAAATVSMQCTCVRMNMAVFAAMFNSKTRMTHVCITCGLGTHLLGLEISAHMLVAVASNDKQSHAEVAKVGRRVYIITSLSMKMTCCKACFSKICPMYANYRRACSLVLDGRSISTDLMWAEALKWSHMLC